MKRMFRITVAGIGLLLGLLIAQSGPRADARPEARTVRIGVVDTVSQGAPPALMALVMRPFKTYMEEQIGMQGEIVSGGDPFALAQKLADDKVQVGIFHGHEFAWAKEKHPGLQAVAVCVCEKTSARVHLVVLNTSKAADYADLKGKTVAVPRKDREYCRLYFERRCVKAGTAPNKFYGKVLTPQEPEQGLDFVVAGKAQAAIVDAISLEQYRKARPGRAKWLKAIQTSEPFPCGVIACYKDRFPEADVAKFRDALINAKSTATGRQTLELFRLTRFAVPPEDHDTQLEAVVKAYPPPKTDR